MSSSVAARIDIVIRLPIRLSGSVTHAWVVEVAADFRRLPLSAPKIPAHIGHQLAFSVRALSSDRVGLDILVETLIRIEIRTVAGRKTKRRRGCLATQRFTTVAWCTGCASTMRTTGRRVWRSKRRRNAMKTAVVNRHLKTMNASRPRLVSAEIILHRNRCPVPGTTGVSPRRPHERPAW